MKNSLKVMKISAKKAKKMFINRIRFNSIYLGVMYLPFALEKLLELYLIVILILTASII